MFLGAYDLEGQLSDRPLDVEMDYFDWVNYDAIGMFIYRTAEQGRIPVVSLEPWTTTSGQLENVLQDTSGGLNDEIIRNVAKTIKASTRQQVLVRWAQEPELTGLYPWSLQDPAPYIDSFQRLHRIFRGRRRHQRGLGLESGRQCKRVWTTTPESSMSTWSESPCSRTATGISRMDSKRNRVLTSCSVKSTGR